MTLMSGVIIILKIYKLKTLHVSFSIIYNNNNDKAPRWGGTSPI